MSPRPFASSPRLRPLFCAMMCSAAAAAAAAQQPAMFRAHPDFAALRDSLNMVSDTVALRHRALARSSDAATLVEQGFAGLRLFALTHRSDDAKRARAAFDDATRSDPANAWAWYGLGLSWADGPERHAATPALVTRRALAEAFGFDPASRAVHALHHALELDPALTGAAQTLVPLALEKRSQSALAAAAGSLARAEEEGRFETAALVALARAEDALGDHQSAVEAARRAATNASAANAADTRYTLSTVLFGNALDDEGARAWFDAIDGLSPALAARYATDLEPLFEDWEHERWQAGDLDAHRAFLRNFWTERAALGGVSVPARLGDHYRRLAGARARFPRNRKWGAPPSNALLLKRPDLPFDDRGLIYVRHGEPWDIIRTPKLGAPPTESWVYRTPEGGFSVLHFDNYASAERSPFAAGDPQASDADGEMGDAYNEYMLMYNLPCDPAWAGDRMRYDRRLALMRCNEFDRRSISAEVRRDARLALRTDSDRPLFSRELPFAYDLYTFRGQQGLTDVTAALLLRGGSIAPEPGRDSVAWSLDVSFILADTVRDRVSRRDTTLTTRTASTLTDAEWLRAHITMPVTPADAVAERLVVRESADPGHGQIYGRALDVPDYSRKELQLSDIVLAAPDSGGSFTRDGVALSLVPTREFPGGAFRIFYEVYNLTPDAAYQTDVRIERPRGGLRKLLGGGTVLTLRFQGSASLRDSLLPELRRVDTSLDPGDYRIRVRVTDSATGQSAEQQRAFTVVR